MAPRATASIAAAMASMPRPATPVAIADGEPDPAGHERGRACCGIAGRGSIRANRSWQSVETVTAPPAHNVTGGLSIARQLGLGVSRIVIDPGHGGHDPGAKGKTVSEAELVAGRRAAAREAAAAGSRRRRDPDAAHR